jgi:hypothetical protein
MGLAQSEVFHSCLISISCHKYDTADHFGAKWFGFSASPNGPRHNPDFPAEQFDALDNFILLCATHHKMIDDQQETYTAEVVRSIKSNHESWVETKLRDDPVRVRRIRQNIPRNLPRIKSGQELLAMATDSCAHYFKHDDDLSDAEAELVGRAAQEIADWIDLSSNMEPFDRVRFSKHIQDLMTELEQHGFYVFAARETRQLEGGIGTPSAFPVLHLCVLRATNSAILHVEHGA